MNGRKTVEVRSKTTTNKDGGYGGDDHQRHPSVAKSAVQFGAIGHTQPSPHGKWADDGGCDGCRHVDGDKR